jgi:hypothetical protein
LYAQDVLELVAKVKAHLGLACFGSGIRVRTLPGPLGLTMKKKTKMMMKKKKRHIHE